jgi:hypothetical protein
MGADTMAADIVINGASALANAATRTLIDGSDFGDNVIAALPDVIGGAIGRRMGGAVISGIAAAGDFLGFDGQFGYQGPDAAKYAFQAPRPTTGTTTDAPEPTGPNQIPRRMSLGGPLAAMAAWLSGFNDSMAQKRFDNALARFGLDGSNAIDVGAATAYLVAGTLGDFPGPIDITKGRRGEAERIGVMLVERAVPGTLANAMAGDEIALTMINGVAQSLRLPASRTNGGNGIATRTPSERLLVDNMAAAGSSHVQISLALDLHRTGSGGISNRGQVNVGAATTSGASMPDWLRLVKAGHAFDRQQSGRYTYNQIYLSNPNGRYTILDSYTPERSIVSRKFTQLRGINQATAFGYLNEMANKYAAGKFPANVPSTPNAILGKALTGDMILEVPVQNRAVPAGVQNLANRLEITIRDPNGRIYNTPPRN